MSLTEHINFVRENRLPVNTARERLGLAPVVHLKRYVGEYPICWTNDQSGIFNGSFEVIDVTCRQCHYYIEEYLL